LPLDRNPRAQALAREMRAGIANDAEYARRALDWFATNGLEYTLQPEPTGLDSVDSVLFDTKRGFCGHFASAYATLMRAAGVPARVVTGYLGGEWNPIGGYFIVRQSDAHAWTEIWLENKGWTRIDPTAVVAPERLRSNLYEVLGDASVPMQLTLMRYAWIGQLARAWDGANQWWRDRVLDFNLRSQLNFLRHLGIESPDWRHLGWGFAGALLLWLLWVAVSLRRSVARVKPDRIARAWIEATRKLGRVAPPREPFEGPMAYAERIAAARPDLAPAVSAIARRYTQLRYGRSAANDDIDALARDVRDLKIGA
jgi:transglutaminase-like putative cysteine protease